MKVWLTQRAEPTPHDHVEGRRPMRTGLMAEYLSTHGEDVLWWTGDFDHYGQRQRLQGNGEIPVSDSFRIRYISADGYRNTKSLSRLRYDRQIGAGFTTLADDYARPEVIVASMPSVDLALASVRYGKANGVPVIVDIRDLHPDVFIEAAPPVVRPLVRLATLPMTAKVVEVCRDATAIWGNSDGFVEWGCRMGGRARGAHDLTLPIAYKPVEVDPAQAATLLSDWRENDLFLPKHLNVVFFGTLPLTSDFATLFTAAKKLDALNTRHRFHFFGSGQQQSYVSAQCARIANCTFHGSVGAATLQTAMGVSEIGLAPFMYTENFAANMPNKAVEYLAGGLAVALAFKTGFLADFFRTTGSGFCYGEPNELVRSLIDLDENPHTLEQARDASRAAFAAHLEYGMLSRRAHNAITSTAKMATDLGESAPPT